jgi:uncharacterized Zn-binding protein involved in type VI secretion
MAGLFPVAGFGDLAEGEIILPCHMTVLIGSTSGEMEPAAMPGSVVRSHGLPPHSGVVLTPIFPTTVFINGKPNMIRTVGDLASCGHPITTGALTVLST